MKAASTKPLIVGIGGTASKSSSTEQALVFALSAAEAAGGRTQLFGGEDLLALPHYVPGSTARNGHGQVLIDAVRAADGLIIASPGYHGTISGLVKNAIDYFEEMAKDERVYLDGTPVGLIATSWLAGDRRNAGCAALDRPRAAWLAHSDGSRHRCQ